jgi:hypothetical protein
LRLLNIILCFYRLGLIFFAFYLRTTLIFIWLHYQYIIFLNRNIFILLTLILIAFRIIIVQDFYLFAFFFYFFLAKFFDSSLELSFLLRWFLLFYVVKFHLLHFFQISIIGRFVLFFLLPCFFLKLLLI